jgi:hypothetical protein
MKNQQFNSTIEAVLARVDIYLELHPEIDEGSFGWYACGDSALIPRLRKGGDITTKRLDMIMKFLSSPPPTIKRKRST